MIIPVVLSGGSGTRLWPLSRKAHPKQLLPLLNDTSLLQDTINRLAGIQGLYETMIICNEDYRFLVAEQAHSTSLAVSDIILEPVGRNTAPAIALAAFNAISKDDDAVLLVLPADHDIRDVKSFHEAVAVGYEEALNGRLVTFGVVPDGPETGYGYIKAADKVSVNQVSSIDSFVEKPDVTTAKEYIEQGDYYWNSGMFMFKAEQYLHALEELAPDMYTACKAAIDAAQRDMDFIRVGIKEFEACPADSIDYAVMEKVDNAVVIPVNIGWSDVGSWSALHDIGIKDADENIMIGDTRSVSTKNTYVRAEHKLVT